MWTYRNSIRQSLIIPVMQSDFKPNSIRTEKRSFTIDTLPCHVVVSSQSLREPTS